MPAVFTNAPNQFAADDREEVQSGPPRQEVAPTGASEQEEPSSGPSGQEENIFEKIKHARSYWETGKWVLKKKWNGASEPEMVPIGASDRAEPSSGTSGGDALATGASEQGVDAEAIGQENVFEKIQHARSYWETAKCVLRRKKWKEHIEYIQDLRSPEVIVQLSSDVELADATVKAYVNHFDFSSVPLLSAFRFFLRVFWPVDEINLQHLLVSHFSLWYLKCNGRSVRLQPAVYNLCWAVILLNADLNGGQKRNKMTCEEFMANLNQISGNISLSKDMLKPIYTSIQNKPLRVFRVKSRHLDDEEGQQEPNVAVRSKSGRLLCKRVKGRNGRKTVMRSWKPVNALLEGMVLKLDEEQPCLRLFNSFSKKQKGSISLHHALAFPLEYKNMPHVLCLTAADSRVFFLQAESKEEQSSWISTINLIAARYSSPPLTSASHGIDNEPERPLVLPSFPSRLSLEKQLQYTRERLRKVSEYVSFCHSETFGKDVAPSAYMDQELKRYSTYLSALEETQKDLYE